MFACAKFSLKWGIENNGRHVALYQGMTSNRVQTYELNGTHHNVSRAKRSNEAPQFKLDHFTVTSSLLLIQTIGTDSFKDFCIVTTGK